MVATMQRSYTDYKDGFTCPAGPGENYLYRTSPFRSIPEAAAGPPGSIDKIPKIPGSSVLKLIPTCVEHTHMFKVNRPTRCSASGPVFGRER